MLGKDEVRRFFEVGYVVRHGVFSPDEIRPLRAAFDRLEAVASRLGRSGMYRGSQFVLETVPDAERGRRVRIHRVVWCGAAESVLSEIGRDPRLVRLAGQLLGSSSMNQLINQAHFKLPGDGVEFPWHQDSTHRRYGRGEWFDANGKGSYVQTVLAIDDVTLDNGPLEFLPGSCALGHVEMPAGEEGRLPTDLVDPRDAVKVTMPAGSLLLFGPYTFHRSRPNRSRHPRRVFINGFAYPGANTRVYPGEGSGRLVHVA